MKRHVNLLAIGLIALLGAACNDAEHTGQTVQVPEGATQRTFEGDATGKKNGKDKLELNTDADGDDGNGSGDWDDGSDFAADRESCKAQGGNWSIINAECHICSDGEVFDGLSCSPASQVDTSKAGLNSSDDELKKKTFDAFGDMLNQLQQNFNSNEGTNPGGGGGGC